MRGSLRAPLALVRRQVSQAWLGRDRVLEALACFGLAFLCGQIIFLRWFHDSFGDIAKSFLMFVFVTWGAVRFGGRGAALVIAMTAVQALLGARAGIGYFSEGLAADGLLAFWLYLLALSLVGTAMVLAIAQRKNNERALRENEERWSFALEGAGDAVWDWNVQTGEVVLSKAGKAMFGLADDEIGNNIAEWAARVHPDDRPALAQALPAIFKSENERFSVEYRVRHRDGGWRWIVTRGTVVSRDAAGKVLRMIGTHTDGTERRLADEKRVRSVLEASPDAMLLVDADGGISFVNRVAADQFGYPAAELLELGVDALLPMSVRADHHQRRAEFWANPKPRPMGANAKLRALRKDGTEFPAEISLSPITLNRKRMVIVTVSDITERRRAEAELKLAATVYRAIGEAILVADADNRIVAVNPTFTKLTGYSEQEAIGRSTTLLKSGRQGKEFYQRMWHALEKTGQWQGQIWNRRKNGEEYLEWLMISSIYDDNGAVQARVALFSDITDQKLAEQTIWQQANFDTLTGLPNRRMFHDRLEQEVKKAHRAGLPVALMFIDLDRFKEVNDTFGHEMGDKLLKDAALRLRSCVRESDTVARLGGDEFTVVLGELEDPASVERVALEILSRLGEPFRLEAKTAYVSASIGITFYPDDATGIDDLLKNADQAMYAAKSQGRNRYNYFTATMQLAAQARQQLGHDLRGALAAGQLMVHYQPIVSLASGRCVKAEALLRWRHPGRGMVGPAEFIPIAEDTGLIVDIGDWVFRQAASRVRQWLEMDSDCVQVSVNISLRQFAAASPLESWLAYLQELDLPSSCINIEVTESMLLDEHPGVAGKLLQFRDAGFQVSLDDFGTGYSVMSYLKKLRIDYLKIDRSFIMDMVEDPADQAIVEAIIVMAHKLGIAVVAEGVETEQQSRLLTAAGCDYAQGYLYAKAVPPEQFELLSTVRRPGN